MNDSESLDSVDDAELAARLEHAQRALERAGLTVQDLLDALPDARAAVLREAYDDEYQREIEKLIAATGKDARSGR